MVPARNESAWIGVTLRSIPAWVDHVVVVDDASVDDTAAIAHGFDSRPEVVTHGFRRGVGAAIVTGYRRAFERGADVVVVMAGDGQMCPDDLPALLEPVVSGRADYAKGDRLSHPDVRHVMPRQRYLAGRALSVLTGLAVGAPRLSDSQSGYTAISRDALARLDLEGLWPGYGYPNDLLGLLAAAGLEAEDVRVRPVYRGERSGLRPFHLVVVGALIARAAVRRVRAAGSQRPSSFAT